jgi:hypothetical protein
MMKSNMATGFGEGAAARLSRAAIEIFYADILDGVPIGKISEWLAKERELAGQVFPFIDYAPTIVGSPSRSYKSSMNIALALPPEGEEPPPQTFYLRCTKNRTGVTNATTKFICGTGSWKIQHDG